jgi:Cys-rich repeat protein
VAAGGCNADADCTSGNWCNESSHACTAKIANGGAVPTDGAHSNPTLNGTCTTAAGALVCTSGVCDTGDNDCGYANGDGPCTATSGATVCRSGACSSSGTCEPAGGCAVDADCASGQYCNESAHTCTPKVANGIAVPTDPGHSNPTLDGTCTVAAGALACVSSVCDTDNSCGFRNGDGPCTPGDGGTSAVCRSGLCASPGDAGAVCVACVADGDCPTGQVCSTSNACVAAAVDAGLADGGLPDGDAGEDSAAEDAPAEAPADALVADAPLDAPAADAPPDGAGGDAAAEDAAVDSAGATDAAQDATEGTGPHPHTRPGEGGFIEGGGCSAAGGRRNASNDDVPGSMLGALTVLGVLAVRRRRAR